MPGIDAVVTGAGGFVEGHLVRALIAEGKSVHAVDRKPFHEWYQLRPHAENLTEDVSLPNTCTRVCTGGVGEVYHLAAGMGGLGCIKNKASCMLSVLSSTHMLVAARECGVDRYFNSSSACVCAAGKQTQTTVVPLREADAYPAMPEDGYGWEKLFSERMARHFREDCGPPPASPATTTSMAPGAHGPAAERWTGGREKAPAAACRNAARAGAQEVEIWGRANRPDPSPTSRLYRGHPPAGPQRSHRAAQHRLGPAGLHQPALRHRRGERGGMAGASARPGASGRTWPQQRQHPDLQRAGMAALHRPPRRT